MAESQKYGTLAWLKPGALDRESLDVFRMTPPDVKLAVFTNTAATSMMENPNFDISSFDAEKRPGILENVQGIVDYAHPAYISVTGDLIQSAMGSAWNQSLVADIERISGAKGATAMSAVTDCLDWIGTKRVAVATPFRKSQNDYMEKYLTDAGYTVTNMGGFDTHSIREVKSLPKDSPLSLGKEVFDADRSAGALLIGCPVWDPAPHIEELEQYTGVPVITVLNVMIWAGLQAIGHPGGVKRFGSILEDAQHPRKALAAVG
jgi:maleate cis-trans isomerase